MMHAKVALFDERWAIVGSSNLDRQSFEHSYEVNLVLEGGGVADSFRESFARDLSHSHMMDAEALAQRSLLDRMLDRMASWVLRII
jgi:cardiolipin synthase